MYISYSTAVILFICYCFATCVFAKDLQKRLGENKPRQLEKYYKALIVINGIIALAMTCVYWHFIMMTTTVRGMPWFFISMLLSALYVINLYDRNHYGKSMGEILKNRWSAPKDEPKD